MNVEVAPDFAVINGIPIPLSPESIQDLDSKILIKYLSNGVINDDIDGHPIFVAKLKNQFKKEQISEWYIDGVNKIIVYKDISMPLSDSIIQQVISMLPQ